MRVFVDHLGCPEWMPASERCLGSFILDPHHFPPRSCFLRVEEDGRPELTLVIYERDHTKVLVVTDENRAQIAFAYQLAPDMWEEAFRGGLITPEEIRAGWRHAA